MKISYLCIHHPNLTQLLQPFLPFAAKEIKTMLGIQVNEWAIQKLLPKEIKELHSLDERIDTKRIEEELSKLYSQSQK